MNKLIYYPPIKVHWYPIYKIKPLTDEKIKDFRYIENILLTDDESWKLFSKKVNWKYRKGIKHELDTYLSRRYYKSSVIKIINEFHKFIMK